MYHSFLIPLLSLPFLGICQSSTSTNSISSSSTSLNSTSLTASFSVPANGTITTSDVDILEPTDNGTASRTCSTIRIIVPCSRSTLTVKPTPRKTCNTGGASQSPIVSPVETDPSPTATLDPTGTIEPDPTDSDVEPTDTGDPDPTNTSDSESEPTNASDSQSISTGNGSSSSRNSNTSSSSRSSTSTFTITTTSTSTTLVGTVAAVAAAAQAAQASPEALAAAAAVGDIDTSSPGDALAPTSPTCKCSIGIVTNTVNYPATTTITDVSQLSVLSSSLSALSSPYTISVIAVPGPTSPPIIVPNPIDGRLPSITLPCCGGGASIYRFEINNENGCGGNGVVATLNTFVLDGTPAPTTIAPTSTLAPGAPTTSPYTFAVQSFLSRYITDIGCSTYNILPTTTVMSTRTVVAILITPSAVARVGGFINRDSQPQQRRTRPRPQDAVQNLAVLVDKFQRDDSVLVGRSKTPLEIARDWILSRASSNSEDKAFTGVSLDLNEGDTSTSSSTDSEIDRTPKEIARDWILSHSGKSAAESINSEEGPPKLEIQQSSEDDSSDSDAAAATPMAVDVNLPTGSGGQNIIININPAPGGNQNIQVTTQDSTPTNTEDGDETEPTETSEPTNTEDSEETTTAEETDTPEPTDTDTDTDTAEETDTSEETDDGTSPTEVGTATVGTVPVSNPTGTINTVTTVGSSQALASMIRASFAAANPQYRRPGRWQVGIGILAIAVNGGARLI